MEVGAQNLVWAKTIISLLVEHGVTFFCLSPGSRSTPLALAIAENPLATNFVHYDERGMAFHALGIAKAKNQPVVILVTSGTALGNILPAVMEAYESFTPLLILTADRPSELRDVMANQTTDQVKIFSNHTRYFFDLPSPSPSLPTTFLKTTIAQVFLSSLHPIKGPVQLNCPFPEPLFQELAHSPSYPTAMQYILPQLSLPLAEIEKLATYFNKIEKGIIVLGGKGSFASASLLSKKCGFPIFADILSGHREKADDRSIPYFHHILKSLPDLTCEAIFYFGDAVVSKVLLQWIGKHTPIFHFAPHFRRCDPLHVTTHRVICNLDQFGQELLPFLEEKKNDWFTQWHTLSQQVNPSFDAQLSEPALVSLLEKRNTALFFANSMPIRDAEMFFFPKTPRSALFGNRGLSGIDGNIATIAGLAQHSPMIAVIGDQTFLHDLNSLIQLKKTKYSTKLIVINNGGGGIFSFLPIRERPKERESHFALNHHMSFEKAALFFDIPYSFAKEPSDFEKALDQEGTAMIEIQTNREENFLLHEKIDQTIKESLCSCFSMAF